MLTLLVKGGPVTWVILGIAGLALIIFIERFLNLRRAQIDVRDFLPGVINTLRNQDVKQAIFICDETPGPAAHIVRQVILHSAEGREGMFRAAREACLSELPRLERFLRVLLAIVHVTPMLGLLGTVVGLIRMFGSLEKGGAAIPLSQMAPDIWAALIATAAGLIVAVLGYLSYHYFYQQVDNILIEMDKAAVEIIYYLSSNPETVVVENSQVPPDTTAKPNGDATPPAPPPEPNPADYAPLPPARGRGRPAPCLTVRQEPAPTAAADDEAKQASGESPTAAFLRTVEATQPRKSGAAPAGPEDELRTGETPTEFFMRAESPTTASNPERPAASASDQPAPGRGDRHHASRNG